MREVSVEKTAATAPPEHSWPSVNVHMPYCPQSALKQLPDKPRAYLIFIEVWSSTENCLIMRETHSP